MACGVDHGNVLKPKCVDELCNAFRVNETVVCFLLHIMRLKLFAV